MGFCAKSSIDFQLRAPQVGQGALVGALVRPPQNHVLLPFKGAPRQALCTPACRGTRPTDRRLPLAFTHSTSSLSRSSSIRTAVRFSSVRRRRRRRRRMLRWSTERFLLGILYLLSSPLRFSLHRTQKHPVYLCAHTYPYAHEPHAFAPPSNGRSRPQSSMGSEWLQSVRYASPQRILVLQL
ncbi:hypothetical protein PENSPDRAFT_297449 [Peniophora sp. CONT]|nr:hypothetical protein PENSPDRAFT_297449 [Peniophora sp. CONT]